MYLTMPQIAEYLSMDEAAIRALVLQGKIRAVYDGEQFLVNTEQFSTHLEQMEKYRAMMQEYLDGALLDEMDV